MSMSINATLLRTALERVGVKCEPNTDAVIAAALTHMNSYLAPRDPSIPNTKPTPLPRPKRTR